MAVLRSGRSAMKRYGLALFVLSLALFLVCVQPAFSAQTPDQNAQAVSISLGGEP